MDFLKPHGKTPENLFIYSETSLPGKVLISLRSKEKTLEEFLDAVRKYLNDHPDYKFFGDWERVATPVGDDGHYVAFINISV